MSNSLVECIPNFSEARRPEVIEEIIKTLKSITGISILDQHSDQDHNRTVVTYIGSPEAVEEAAFQAIKKASMLIDLNFHSGEHPRIGATDVVPFVPIKNISMADCVLMAKNLGKRVGTELNIPVYLYEEAAQIPERQNLETIRKGQFEGLKEDIKFNEARKPDFGPSALGPAGATVIGARQPLIAYNVYLTTDDVKIARKIAKAVRQSSGGFKYVKGMGILVDGRAQVSMNLTNSRQTPIARVVESIRREAQRYGVSIHHSELVGMIPQEALVDAAVWYLQLDDFSPDQILEQKLTDALSQNESKSAGPDFIDQLAGGTPTPGGGSAAAHTASAAAALVSMVSRLTLGKKKYADAEHDMESNLKKAEKLRSELTQAVELDSEAFNQFMSARKLPKDTPEQIAQREKAILDAGLYAAKIPLEVARKSIDVFELALLSAEKGNINAISDSGTAGMLAKAAFSSAALNVKINLTDTVENSTAQSYLQEISSLQKKIQSLEEQMKLAIKNRSNLELV